MNTFTTFVHFQFIFPFFYGFFLGGGRNGYLLVPLVPFEM